MNDATNKGNKMNVKILGTTDEINSCECCGRQNLKKTVAISFNGNDPVFYGTTCAAVAVKWTNTDIRKAAQKADQEKIDKEHQTCKLEMETKANDWLSWLDINAISGDCTFTKIESLGGYAKAKAIYNEYLKSEKNK